jgi:transcriptional regulator with XRE-family HTH domain
MSHPIDIHLGEKIRARRLLQDITQVDLGLACGVSKQQIQKYETGQNRMTVSRLFDIAKAIGVNLTWFVDREEPKYPSKENKRINALVRRFSTLTEPQQKIITKLVKDMSDD